MEATVDASGDGGQADGEDADVGVADRVLAVVLAAFVGLAGLFAIVGWRLLLSGSLETVVTDPSPLLTQGIGSLSNGLGGITVGLVFLYASGRGVEYLDLPRPSRRDLVYAVAGVVALLVAQYGVQLVYAVFDLEAASHGLADTVRENPEVLAVLIPGSWLFVAPGEELLYRNAIQKSLYDSFPTWGAIVVTSGVFALVHFPAFVGGSTGATLASLALVFFLSFVLGWIYARTGNLLVPVFVHGTFNAIQFLLLHPDLAWVGVAG